MSDEKKLDVIMVAQTIMSDTLAEFHDYPDALRNLCLQLAQEREKSAELLDEHAGMLSRHGQFCADVTYAAFGQTGTLTHEQIVGSLRELRKNAESAADYGEDLRSL